MQCKGTITVCLPASEVAHTKGDTKYAFQAATCEEEGHQAYWLCEVCGCYLDKNGNKMEEKDVILPAKGHYWETSETVPPTCTEDGTRLWSVSDAMLPVPNRTKLRMDIRLWR